jgi:hypothetical protein
VVGIAYVAEPDLLKHPPTGNVLDCGKRPQLGVAVAAVPADQPGGNLGGQSLTPQVTAKRVPQLPAIAVFVCTEPSATDKRAVPVGDPPLRPAAVVLLIEVGREQGLNLGTCLGATVANQPHRHRVGVQAM